MVQGQQILMFYTTIVHTANVCRYKILRLWANPEKYQMLVPAIISHLKVGGSTKSLSVRGWAKEEEVRKTSQFK